METQKDHFPHYFLVEGNVAKTLNYVGPLPDYEYFEPKRTSQADYADILEQYKDKEWSFLKVSEQYILGDVKAQYQIIVKYFNTLREPFPINPLKNISAPGIAFTTWRTPVILTPDQFDQVGLFGYLIGTVRVPETQYIGLLPIRHNGRLVCPGGTFEGFFFSEEQRKQELIHFKVCRQVSGVD